MRSLRNVFPFLLRDATQCAVLFGLPSVCVVQESWSHGLKFFETTLIAY